MVVLSYYKRIFSFKYIRRFQCTQSGEPLPLVFVRHGQSTWNQKNIFIGMTDTPLTEDGILEARVAGRLLAGEGVI